MWFYIVYVKIYKICILYIFFVTLSFKDNIYIIYIKKTKFKGKNSCDKKNDVF